MQIEKCQNSLFIDVILENRGEARERKTRKKEDPVLDNL